jgi:hypothetical protein
MGNNSPLFNYQPSKRTIRRNGYKTSPNVKTVIVSYVELKRNLGYVSIFLPFMFLFSSLLYNQPLLPSISHYYYSKFGTIFTGILFAISMFMWHYNGKLRYESFIAKAASVSILFVAIFPTSILEEFKMIQGKTYTIDDFNNFVNPSMPLPDFVGNFHYIAAAFFFSLLILLVLNYFIKSEKTQSRIKIFKICGYGMALAFSTIVILSFFSENEQSWTFPLTFMCELIALVLFGISWITKGNSEKDELKI